MLKVKPILLFIIASIALHWWVLSLPIFQKIRTLENTGPTRSTTTIIAKLSKNHVPLDAQKTSELDTSSRSEDDKQRISQPQPQPTPPSFLRGSPWSRRPLDSFYGKPAGSSETTIFTQIEFNLQNEFTIDQAINLECKRSGIERLFTCQEENNEAFSEKVAKVLNQKTSSTPYLPDCLNLEAQQKKWHVRACHS